MNKESNPQSNESTKSSKNIYIIIIVIVVAILISSGVYFWKKTNSKSDKQNLQQKVQTSQNEINEQKNSQTKQWKSDLSEGKISSSEAKNIIQSRLEETISAIKDQDGSKLASLVHPYLGVRFSPYASIDTKNDLIFTSSQIQSIFSNSAKYVWGAYDGSGLPIELTFKEYYNKFIYNKDFKDAEIGYNKAISQGNTLNNSFEIYPNAIIVEFYYKGSDEDMDWSSLRLVFEQSNSVWYLIGIIHDEWTT